MEAAPGEPAGEANPFVERRVAQRREGPSSRSLRVDAVKVDRLLDAVGETVLHRRRLDHLLDEPERRSDQVVDDELGDGERLLDELQDAVLRLRTLPLSSIAGRYPRAVRDLAAAEGKDVVLELVGTETQLDRVILDGVSEMIVHLLRNAISHGVERPEERIQAGKSARARIELRAEPRGALVAISVADDGRGVSEELMRRGQATGSLAEVLSQAGLSTAAEVTDLAGRGVGLDAVKQHVESLGGSLEVSSEPGSGTRMTMLLPLTLAVLQLLLVDRGGQVFGIPLASVSEVVSVDTGACLTLGGRRSIELRGEVVPVVDLADVLGATAPDPPASAPALVLGSSSRRVALQCDSVLGEQQAVVKTLGPLLAGVRGYLGGAILDDGRIALIIDSSFARRNPTRVRACASAHAPAGPVPKVLVVDDQFMARELQRSILETVGYRVCTAENGAEALELLVIDPDIRLVVTDIEMPEMDGLSLCRAIRDRPALRSLPVVVVTSLADAEDRDRGAQAGADAYIVKSDFHQESLLETVNRLLRL